MTWLDKGGLLKVGLLLWAFVSVASVFMSLYMYNTGHLRHSYYWVALAIYGQLMFLTLFFGDKV